MQRRHILSYGEYTTNIPKKILFFCHQKIKHFRTGDRLRMRHDITLNFTCSDTVYHFLRFINKTVFGCFVFKSLNLIALLII